MILPIYVYGSEVLREQAAKLDYKDEKLQAELKELIPNMFETMENSDGVGLAAPQIGKSVQLLVIDGSPLQEDMPDLKGFRFAMINPEVVEESKETAEYSEGCLSVPDIHADVIRPAKIKVRYIDENFEEVEREFNNFGCRIVQHEMDHLKGILFTDKVSQIRKKLIAGKLNNIANGKVRTNYKIVRKPKR